MTAVRQIFKRKPLAKSHPLTTLERAFVCEYIVSKNATAAAKLAGYKGPNPGQRGSTMAHRPHVMAAIKKEELRQNQKLTLNADRVLLEIMRLAFFDISRAYDADGNLLKVHDMPEDIRRAIIAIDVDEIFSGTGDNRTHTGNVHRVKFADKSKALEQLGRHLKLFGDQIAAAQFDITVRLDDALKRVADIRGADIVDVDYEDADTIAGDSADVSASDGT